MTLENVTEAFRNILAVEKSAGKNTPQYYATYERAVKQYKAVRNHADTEVFPEELFKERAPNQTDEQHKYVRANYKCTTNPVWQDYMTVIARTFIDSNWSINWPDEAKGENGLQEYCEKYFPIYRSIEAFFKNLGIPLKGMDANGIIAVHTLPPNMVENEQGEQVLDETELLKPALFYYPSERILYRSDDLYICVSTEKSIVTIAKQPKREGRVLYAYTKEAIYRIEQVGAKNENTYDTYVILEHGEGVNSAHDLMGSAMMAEDGAIYWRSPFYFAVPLLDFALTSRNILQVSIANTAFPFRVIRTSPCDFEDGDGKCVGGVYTNFGNGNRSKCKSCDGKGHRVPVSPTGEYQWMEPEGTNDGKGMSYKPVEYIEPSTNAMTFVREQAEIDTNQARGILHLHTSANKSKGEASVTATEVAMDYSTQFAFLRPIAEQIFDLFEWSINRVSFQRYGNYDQVPVIVRPQNFDFRTEAQLWADLERARNAGAPPYMVNDILHKLLMSSLSSDIDAQRVALSVMMVDELFPLTLAEVTARKASNSVEPWQISFHHGAHQIVSQLMSENENWITLEDKDRATALREYAKQKAPASIQQTPVNDFFGTFGA